MRATDKDLTVLDICMYIEMRVRIYSSVWAKLSSSNTLGKTLAMSSIYFDFFFLHITQSITAAEQTRLFIAAVMAAAVAVVALSKYLDRVIANKRYYYYIGTCVYDQVNSVRKINKQMSRSRYYYCSDCCRNVFFNIFIDHHHARSYYYYYNFICKYYMLSCNIFVLMYVIVCSRTHTCIIIMRSTTRVYSIIIICVWRTIYKATGKGHAGRRGHRRF